MIRVIPSCHVRVTRPCFHASVNVMDRKRRPIGHYEAYSDSPTIANGVYDTCVAYASQTGGSRTCGTVRLSMTFNPPDCDNRVQFYFADDSGKWIKFLQFLNYFFRIFCRSKTHYLPFVGQSHNINPQKFPG